MSAQYVLTFVIDPALVSHHTHYIAQKGKGTTRSNIYCLMKATLKATDKEGTRYVSWEYAAVTQHKHYHPNTTISKTNNCIYVLNTRLFNSSIIKLISFVAPPRASLFSTPLRIK